MGDNEFEESQSDFEVKIADLDEPDSASGSLRPQRLMPLSRFSPRQRRLGLIGINSILILVIGIFLISMAPVRGLMSSILFRPTPSPTPTLTPGVDLFYVRVDPSWGQLFIDGHPTSLPNIGVDPPLRLARGQHLLVWQAEPFLTQRCTVSVPPMVTDTCSDHETTPTSTGLSAWVISFSMSLATLSSEQRAALLQVAQVALDARQSTATVRPRERYVLAPDNPACATHTQGYQCYATASQPLRATLSFRLDAGEASNEACIDPQPGVCTFNYQDCRLFCAGSSPAPSSSWEWDVFAPALSFWTFTTMDGRVLARDVPDDSSYDYATGEILDESLVELSITWDGPGWHVIAMTNVDKNSTAPDYSGYFNPACAATTQAVQMLEPPAVNGGDPIYLQWQFASGTQPATGCLAVGRSQQGNGLIISTPTHATPPVFYYLHRFGVLLAVNRLAQSAKLSLPLVDAYEQLLVQGLIGK